MFAGSHGDTWCSSLRKYNGFQFNFYNKAGEAWGSTLAYITKVQILVKLGFYSLQMERTAGQSSGSNFQWGNWQKVQRFPEFLEEADQTSSSYPKWCWHLLSQITTDLLEHRKLIVTLKLKRIDLKDNWINIS